MSSAAQKYKNVGGCKEFPHWEEEEEAAGAVRRCGLSILPDSPGIDLHVYCWI